MNTYYADYPSSYPLSSCWCLMLSTLSGGPCSPMRLLSAAPRCFVGEILDFKQGWRCLQRSTICRSSCRSRWPSVRDLYVTAARWFRFVFARRGNLLAPTTMNRKDVQELLPNALSGFCKSATLVRADAFFSIEQGDHSANPTHQSSHADRAVFSW